MPLQLPSRDLRAFSESVLLYEFEMLSNLAQLSVRVLTGQVEREWFEQNANLESLLIHARQLAHFFYGGPKQRNRNAASKDADARVEDYFQHPSDLGSWRPKRSKVLTEENLAIRVNREIAHATYWRTHANEIKPTWPPYAIFASVADIMDRFADAVDPALVVDDFVERVRKAIPHRQPDPPEPHRPGAYFVSPTAWVGATAASPDLDISDTDE